MSLRKKLYEKAYKRDNKRAVDLVIEEEFNFLYNDNFHDYWHDMYCDQDQEPTLKDIATGRLLTILNKLRVRSSNDILKYWHW